MIDVICPQNQIFLDYWQEIQPVDKIPDVSNFHPEEVHKILASFTVYELVSQDCILIRKGGTAIERRGDFEQKGENYLNLVAPERRKKAAGAFYAMYNQPCGMRVIMQQTLATGTNITFEGLGLPFVNDRGGNPLVYITNHEVLNPEKHVTIIDGKLEGMALLSRDFIDVGFGISNYQD